MNVDFNFFKSLGFKNKTTVTFLKALETQGLCHLVLVSQSDKKSKVEISCNEETLFSRMFNMEAKAITNNDLVDLAPKSTALLETSNNLVSYEEVKAIKLKYPINPQNRYFKHFTIGHKQQFLKSFAARVDKGKLSLEALDEAFSGLSQHENYSLADIFNSLIKFNSYNLADSLFDFVWIQTEGKISSISMEAKGKKQLLLLLENNATSLAEIEDCWLFMLNGELNYTLSLVSLSKALQQFQKFRVELPDGRFGFKKKVDNGKTSAYNQSMSNFNQWANS